MTNAQQCGVTLQTLDANTFDTGVILAQPPPHGIPRKEKCTYFDLLNYLTPIAATTLVQGLRDRVFVPPLKDVGWLRNIKPSTENDKAKLTQIVHAPKITSANRCVNWTSDSAISIERRYRAFGRLWTEILFAGGVKKRIILEDMELVPMPGVIEGLLKHASTTRKGTVQVSVETMRQVRFMVTGAKTSVDETTKEKEYLKPRFFVVDGDAAIFACKNGALRVKQITVEGKEKQHARLVLEGAKGWDQWRLRMENYVLLAKKLESKELSMGGEANTDSRSKEVEEGTEKASV